MLHKCPKFGRCFIKGVTEANKAALAKRVVHFDYDSSDLSAEDYQTLQAHAQFLMANANSKVALTGHTDERGTREYNMALGERRAKAVQSYLITSGVNPQQLEAVSYGKKRQLIQDMTNQHGKKTAVLKLTMKRFLPIKIKHLKINAQIWAFIFILNLRRFIFLFF